MIDNMEKKDCTGCKACGDSCPNNAISFTVDNEGFWYPNVSSDSCTNCGLCVKVCPTKNKLIELKNAPVVYAAWSKNEAVRIKSTSGGIYSELAKGMLDQDGYIAGCVFTDDYKHAEHIVGKSMEDLDRIYRSKYFQSDTTGIYSKVKKLLDNGEKVLFSGSPCQNAALIQFLGKQYDGLTQCDYICRGINSPKAHIKHLEELEKKYKSDVEFVNFKNKKEGWLQLGLYIRFKNGKTYFSNRLNCPWTTGYVIGNLYMRPSCHNCQFKEMPRVSDISFGDFWGLKKGKSDMYNGISVVMINSERGERLFNAIKSQIHTELSTLEVAASGNKCIYNSALYGKHRDEFFKRIDNEPFSKIVWDLTGISKYTRFKRNMKFKIKQFLGR